MYGVQEALLGSQPSVQPLTKGSAVLLIRASTSPTLLFTPQLPRCVTGGQQILDLPRTGPCPWDVPSPPNPSFPDAEMK